MADSNIQKSPYTPWKNGHYQSKAMPSTLMYLEGEHMCFYPASGKPTNIKDNPMMNGTLKYGDYGEAHPDVAKETGKLKYNVQVIKAYTLIVSFMPAISALSGNLGLQASANTIRGLGTGRD